MNIISAKIKNNQKNSVNERANAFVYTKTEFDQNGWADAEKYKPIPYDMLVLFTDKGEEKSGWWADRFWDGLKVKRSDRIVKWKKVLYEYYNR